MISLQQVQGQQFKGISLQGKIKKNLQVEGYSTMTKMTFMFTKPKITFLPQISEILNSIPVSFSNPYLQPVGKNAKIIVTKFCSLASFVTTGLLPITEVVNNRICVQTQLFPIFTCFRSKSSLVNQCFWKYQAIAFYLHLSWHHCARCWYQKNIKLLSLVLCQSWPLSLFNPCLSVSWGNVSIFFFSF